jgi:hypothetical protein
MFQLIWIFQAVDAAQKQNLGQFGVFLHVSTKPNKADEADRSKNDEISN